MATQQYVSHLTAVGDRWDLIAWQYYGDPTQYSGLIAINASIPIVPVLDSGLSIVVPIVTASSQPASNLPPWKAST